ncbi:MAG: hypothetical protein ACK5WS_04235 [Alphaproteobacteria bacterium]|jgi:hypothetical protein
MVFLIYQNNKHSGNYGFGEEQQEVIGRYNIEVNPKKPESEMTLPEKLILWSFAEKLKSVENQNTVIDRVPSHDDSEDRRKTPIKKGDKVLLIMADVSSDTPKEPLMILVGDAMQGVEVDEAVIGLRVNDIRMVTINNKTYHITILAVNPIENELVSKES